MSLPVAIQFVGVIVAIMVVCVSLFQWRRPRMMFFTFFALTTCMLALGYMLELTATTLDGAVIACKITYIGSPFTLVFYYLFVRDYCNRPVKRLRWVLLLCALPTVISLLVLTWPLQSLYYANLSFNPNAMFSGLVITPGPLYYTSFIYGMLLAVLSCIAVIRYYRHTGSRGRRYSIAFFIITAIPALGGLAMLTGLSPAGFAPIPLSITCNAAIMCVYFTRIRSREWQILGREAVLQNMSDAFILVDTKGRFLDANQMAFNYFPALAKTRSGTHISQVDGIPPQLFSPPDENIELPLSRDGKTHFLRVSRSPLEVDGTLLGTSILIYDNTENHHLMERLHTLATHDTLTGLYNRGTFFSLATRDFELCLRNHGPGSVLMLDIDNFKQVNDRYGHACGDSVLIAISKVLSSRLRRTDILGRYGGEEFAVWLTGANAESAVTIADELRRAAKDTPLTGDDAIFHVTLSIGVSSLDHIRPNTFEDLLNIADSALYQAKGEGRNRVCVPSQQPTAGT